MAGSQSASQTTRRIAVFATDSRVFPEELSALVRRLAQQGHRVRCYAPVWPDHVAKLAIASGAETDTFPIAIDETWRLLPQRALRRQRASVIAGWNPETVIAIGPAASGMILPEVAASGVDRVAVLDRWALKDEAPEDLEDDRVLDDEALFRLGGCADRIICHTQHDAKRLTQALSRVKRDAPHVVALPGYGVSVQDLKPAPLPPHDDGLTFLLTAPLDHWKGVRDYAAAAAIIRTKDASHRFRIQAAPGRTADAVPRDEILSSGHLEAVEPSEGLHAAIKSSHVVVVASHHDGLPRELLHALALGRPVIAADLPGSREAVDEPVNGTWFDPGNPGALAGAITRMTRRPDLLPAMSRAARLKAERRFDEADILRQYLRLIGVAA